MSLGSLAGDVGVVLLFFVCFIGVVDWWIDGLLLFVL